MKDKSTHIIFGVIIIVLITLFALLWDNTQYDWNEHYRENGKEPYGTLVINSLLKKYFPSEEFEVIKNGLTEKLPLEDENGNYVFIGEAMYLDSADTQHLLHFVDAGNNAFISSKTIPYDLINYIYYDECTDAYWDDYYTMMDTIAVLNFEHEQLRDSSAFNIVFYDRDKPQSYSWAYFNNLVFCEEEYGFVRLGHITDEFYEYTNFAKAKYGDGTFYLHTTPLAFTNISLLKERGYEYANRVFSHLESGKIFWDQFSRVPESVSRRRNRNYRGSRNNMDQGNELKYVLSQPPLAWAWYLTFGLGLLYLIFRAKRKQRIIPVLEKNANTSLAFIGTIGRLNFLQNNHRKLALQKTKLFLGYVRDRYHIPTKELDKNFVETLSRKSEVPKEEIEKILMVHQNIKRSGFLSENSLVQFHQYLDGFYKKCK